MKIQHTLKALSDGLANKQFSSKELTQYYLERISQYNQQLNCFITVATEQVLKQAEAADKLRAEGKTAPLIGIPIAHKDIFCTAGIKTSCGSKMLDNFISPYDATVVKNLADSGCIMLGKLNMDEFAMGSSNENSYYGPVKNPWDLNCVPGGSSGGSAAAVAARLTPMATGTDTGGSIRQPAAFCGISGIKPTYGRASRFGMIAFASSLDQAGPMAQTAEDLAMTLNVMSGFDDKDSTSLNQPNEDYTADLNQPLKGLKIGLPKEYFNQDLEPSMAKCLEEAIDVFKAQGAEVKEISLPASELAVATYYVIAPAEASSNLARYDGVRYGYRSDNANGLDQFYKHTRSEGFGAEVQRRIMTGTYVLSAGYYDAYYIQAQRVRRLIKNDFIAAFNQVDVILGPTTPTPAFKTGEKSKDPIAMYYSDVYTIAANLAGIPALSIPAGFIDKKPVGLQLMGNYLTESKLLNVAHQYQQNTDWHLKVPDKFKD